VGRDPICYWSENTNLQYVEQTKNPCTGYERWLFSTVPHHWHRKLTRHIIFQYSVPRVCWRQLINCAFNTSHIRWGIKQSSETSVASASYRCYDPVVVVPTSDSTHPDQVNLFEAILNETVTPVIRSTHLLCEGRHWRTYHDISCSSIPFVAHPNRISQQQRRQLREHVKVSLGHHRHCLIGFPRTYPIAVELSRAN